LRFILPVVVIAAVIYLIVRYATRGQRRSASSTRAAPRPPPIKTITEPAVTEPSTAPRAAEPLRESVSTEPRTVEAEAVPRPAPTESPSDLSSSDLSSNDLEAPARRDPKEPGEG
jgi:hypothetical protein